MPDSDRPTETAPPARSKPKRRGILPVRLVRIAAFAVISLAIFACAVLCLLAVWDFATTDTAWRAFASLGIIAGAMIAFVFVNEAFGASLKA